MHDDRTLRLVEPLPPAKQCTTLEKLHETSLLDLLHEGIGVGRYVTELLTEIRRDSPYATEPC